MPTDHQIVSFSDDKTVIQWDMASEAVLHKYEGHTVRFLCYIEINFNLIGLFINSSYLEILNRIMFEVVARFSLILT